MKISRMYISATILSAVFSPFFFSPLAAAEPDYSALNRVLAKHVQAGARAGIPANLVNYKKLSKDADFTAAVKAISEFDTTQLKTRNEKLAFYINAYNVAAVRKVLEKYPTASIRDAGDGVWKQNAITLAGKASSLDAIEHQILRPMGDARMHFAIVCASLSCPDLRREAYTAAKLNAQLDDQTRRFLSNTAKGLRLDGNRVFQSAIFSWFKDDFKDVAKFQGRYVKKLPAQAERIELPYDWKLNE
ncbi:MAG: DUF547 domain-containing protein [Turneriella sp.]